MVFYFQAVIAKLLFFAGAVCEVCLGVVTWGEKAL